MSEKESRWVIHQTLEEKWAQQEDSRGYHLEKTTRGGYTMEKVTKVSSGEGISCGVRIRPRTATSRYQAGRIGRGIGVMGRRWPHGGSL